LINALIGYQWQFFFHRLLGRKSHKRTIIYVIVAPLGETPEDDVAAMAPFKDPTNIGSGGGKPT
jgi:hypothetical protein